MIRIVPSALLLLVAVLAGIETAAHCPGCLERDRVNNRCDWIGDRSFAIGLENSGDRAHLVADAQLAEDLAIRYGDAEFNRLYGHEAHGGLCDHGRVVRECMAQLVAAIERNHGVTADQIAAARGERSVAFDAIAALSFVPLLVFGAATVSRRIDRRFAADRPAVRLTAVALASIGAALLTFQISQLWLGVWEALRVRNGHISMFRSATWNRWPQQHAVMLLVGAGAAFWIVTAVAARLSRVAMINAAAFACAMVGAMFVDVFVQRFLAYAAVIVVTLGIAFAASHADAPAAG
jgi:hypothetical protein